jgi:dihydroorotate dehydrogenase electron transfer subunit
MRDAVCDVVENRDLGGGVWLLRLRDPDMAAEMAPGCFIMLQVGPDLAPTLRRPFSIQRCEGDVYDVLYRVVGGGTALMAKFVAGETVRVLGPMGNSFTTPEPDEVAILLGGGVGIPPMVALADDLVARGHTGFQAYVGVSSQSDGGCWVGFDRFGDDPRITRATMDGSVGFEGHVVGAWLDRWQREGAPKKARVYSCGPMVMLNAVEKAAARLGVPAEVSVETMMGCGMGACMSCVIESSDAKDPVKRAAMSPYDRWLLACRKGPVFAAGTVVLDHGEFLH